MVQQLKILAILFLGAIHLQVSAQTFTVETVPDPKQNPSAHFVSNPAQILSAQAVAHIDSILGRMEDSTTAQVAVVVLPSIGEAVPKDFAHALFKKWGVGYAQKDNGLLLLFVLDQRRVEFETGYGLEGVMPDVVCARIQREKMVPAFKQGDYNGGLVAGVEAIANTLNQPAAAQEIYAGDRYGSTYDFEKLRMEELVILALLFCVVISFLRLMRFIVRSANPIKQQVDKVIRQKKGHWLMGILLYWVVPFGLACLLGYFEETFYLTLESAIFGCYAYLAFLVWDSRARREVAFDGLFGKMPEPDLYVRRKTANRFYWFDALLLPVPMAAYWHNNRKRLHDLRYHPRSSADGHPLLCLNDALKAPFLTPYQKVEVSLNTVEYDVWRNEAHNITETVGYENLSNTQYTRCNHCHSKAVGKVSEEILEVATLEKTGRSRRHLQCKACQTTSTQDFTTPKIVPATSSSSSSYGGSSGSSSSSSSSSSGGSSWGGGSSGGGGAGSSW